MSDELKACPFCGVSRVSAWAGTVKCDACHGTIAGDSQCEAIAAWNRRVVTREQVEKMAEAAHNRFWGASSEGLYDTDGVAEIWEAVACAALSAAGFEVAE